MMPTRILRRNQTFALLCGLSSNLALIGCSEPLELQVALRSAVNPDPFFRVRLVRVVAWDDGVSRILDSVRWDQGPRPLQLGLPLSSRRVWVEGIDDEGRILSAAMSPSLDLISEPVEALELAFAEIGALSVLPNKVEARQGWRAASLGEEGVLLLGGAIGEQTPSSTLLIDRWGQLVPGPPLPGGRVGASVASNEGRVVVWGGRSEETPATESAGEWAVLSLAEGYRSAPNPIPPGNSPILVNLDDSDGPRLTVLNSATAAVAELNVEPPMGSTVGNLQEVLEGAAVARFRTGQLIVASATAAVYDMRSLGTVGPRVPLASGRQRYAAARTTSAMSTVVVGGVDPKTSEPVPGVTTLRFPLDGTRTGTASIFAEAPVGAARLYDAGGGWLLAAPQAGGPSYSMRLFDPQVRALTEVRELYDLASHPDGTLRGVADDGSLLIFTPGPGIFAPQTATGAGLIPRTPEAWRPARGAIQGTAPNRPVQPPFPETWAVLGEQIFGDFELEMRVEPEPGGRAAVLFDFSEDGYGLVSLGPTLRVRAGPGRLTINCPPADGLGPAEDTVFRVRIEREGLELRVGIGAEDDFQLICSLSEDPANEVGRLAVAVSRGTIRFRELRLSGDSG